MRLQLLQIYLCVLESGSLAAAARLQYMTQPAISMAISSLESELGQPLLIRHSGQRNRIEPTPAGVIFAEYARKALTDYRNMCTSLSAAQGDLKPFILATTPGPGSVVVPVLVNHFKAENPHAPFQINTYSGTEIFRRLTAGEYDIAITGTHPSSKEVIFEQFFYDPVELICPASFGIKRTITIRDFCSLPLIIRNNSSNVMQLVLKEFERAKIDISKMNIAMQVYGNTDVLQAVSLGSGVGFVTRSLLATNRDYNNVIAVQVKKFRVDRFLYLVRQKKAPFTPEMRLFWEFAVGTSWREKAFPYNTLTIEHSHDHSS